MKNFLRNIFLVLLLTLGFVSLSFATDFDDEPTTSWKSDGFELMGLINGILKIMTFTNSSDFVNKGNYKITFVDPMDNTHVAQTAYLNVTQVDGNSPMYVKFVIKDEGDGRRRYVSVKVNKSVSSQYPLGDLELVTYAFDPNIQNLSDWNSSNTIGSDRLKFVISATGNGATIKLNTDDKENTNGGMTMYSPWMNIVVSDADFTNGYGKMSSFGNSTALQVAFDNDYIVDFNGSGGDIFYRSQFDDTVYEYKLFTTAGANINLPVNEVSAFSFRKESPEAWGFLGANYEHNTTDGTQNTPAWSGKYYVEDDSVFSVGDTIIDNTDGTQYKITAIDKSNDFMMISKNDANQSVSTWEEANITVSGTSYNFYKSGRKLFAPMNCSSGECIPLVNLTSGNNYDLNISGTTTTYKVKATMFVQKIKKIATEANYQNLSTAVPASKSSQVDALETKVTVDANLSNPNLDYSTTDSRIEDVRTWFENEILGHENSIELKVVNGENI